MRRSATAFAAALALAAPAAGCGGAEGGGGRAGEALTVYAGRPEPLLGPLLAHFEEATGVALEVRYGDAAVLVHRLAEEGEATPADVLVLPSAGALGAAERTGALAALPRRVLRRVGERARSRSGRWVGTAAREIVLAYATERADPRTLPRTPLGLTAQRWRARVALPPPDAALQDAVSAVRLGAGDARARAWLEGLRANEPFLVEDEAQALDALAAGDADLALVTRSAVRAARAARPGLSVATRTLHAPGGDAPLGIVAGAAIVEGSQEAEDARRLVAFLLSPPAQADARARLFERPLAGAGAPVPPSAVDPRALGGAYDASRALLTELGFTV